MATSVFRKGNTALITGGASGIGLALAKRCHKAGMKVSCLTLSHWELDSSCSGRLHETCVEIPLQHNLCQTKANHHHAQVALVDINQKNLELAKKNVGEETSIYPMDVGNPSDWASLKKSIDEKYGIPPDPYI